jgi:hypothetical protein
MSSKFEQLLDYLVNEEQDKANELFHEIVVEKSREIYENLIAEEEDEEEEKDMDESMDEEDEEAMDESMDEEDEEAETVESMFGEADFGGDETDDFEADVTDSEFGGFGDEEDDMGGMDDMDDMGGEDDGEPATKGDILDLEDAIEELKAEFESLMGSLDADGDGDHDMEDHGMDDEEDMDDMGDDEGDMGDEEDEGEDDTEMKFEGRKSQGETMREYIEKITATMDGGLVGGRTGETMTAPKEGKSPISSGSGKPTSGATAKNITQAGKGADEDGTSPKGKVGGLVKSGGKFVGSGTHNVDKVKSGIKTLKAVSKPGNKEGQGWGSGSGDKAGQTGSVDTKSPLTGAPNRAK